MIGQYRIIPKGTEFWSIKNQSILTSIKDEIVEIKHTCHGSDGVFVEPQQLLYNFAGFIPALIGKGSDEWSLRYSETLPYVIPEPKF